jgi:hypothetical protein
MEANASKALAIDSHDTLPAVHLLKHPAAGFVPVAD